MNETLAYVSGCSTYARAPRNTQSTRDVREESRTVKNTGAPSAPRLLEHLWSTTPGGVVSGGAPLPLGSTTTTTTERYRSTTLKIVWSTWDMEHSGADQVDR